MRSNKAAIVLTVSTIAVSAYSPLASAQKSGDDAESLQLEEVIVTAEKRETNLQKTSISIQVYSGETLQKEGKKRIDEIMEGVVGVQSQGSQVGTDFYIRGIGNSGGPGGGAKAVSIIVDGVVQDRSEVVRGATLDVSQVEVMRGVQSTTQGANNLAGAVSIVSNQPVFEYKASGNVEFGNYNLFSAEGVLNMPTTNNQALRVAFSQSRRDGYLTSGAGDSDQTNGRIRYRWQPTDTLDLVFTGSYQHIGGNGVSTGVLTYKGYWEPYVASKCTASTSCAYDITMGFPRAYGHIDNSVTYKDRSNPWDDGYPAYRWPSDAYRDTRILNWSTDINWTLGFGTLTATPSIANSHFKSSEPPRDTSYRIEDQVQRTEQIDLRFSSKQESRLQWLAGVNAYHTNQPGTFLTVQNPSSSSSSSSGPGGPGGPSGGGTSSSTSCSLPTTPTEYNLSNCYSWSRTLESSQTTLSGYTNGTWSVTDTLRAIGGLRYNWAKSNSRSVTYASTDGSNGDMNGPTGVATESTTSSSPSTGTTYRAGFEWDALDNSMLYATYQTGWQATPQDTMSSTASKPQTIEQSTLGFKSRFLDNRLQFNLEAFNSVYHNRTLQNQLSAQYLDSTSTTTCTSSSSTSTMGPPGGPGGSTTTWTVGSSLDCASYGGQLQVKNMYSRGVDVELSWVPTGADRVDVSMEYLDSYQGRPNLTVTAQELVSQWESDNSTTASATQQANATALAAKFNSYIDTFEGLTLQNSPKWTANLTYQHAFNLKGGSSLTPKLNAVYKTKYWSSSGGRNADIANPAEAYQQAYSLYNAYLSWQSADGKFGINGNVKNIQNRAILTNYATPYVSLADPRTFSVSITGNF